MLSRVLYGMLSLMESQLKQNSFFFALMFAFSQIQLGTSPLISLLVIVGVVVLTLLVTMILGIGRKMAQPQMQLMKDFVKEVF